MFGDGCKGEGGLVWVHGRKFSARPDWTPNILVVLSLDEAGLDPLEREVGVGFV